MLAFANGQEAAKSDRTARRKGNFAGTTMSVNFGSCKIIYEKYCCSLASRRKITKTRSMLRLLWLISALLMSSLPSLVACEGCKEPSNVIGASGVGGLERAFHGAFFS